MAPFVAHAAGHWASASPARQAQAQRASLTQVTATLVRKAPIWSGALAGGTVRIWVDQAGQLAGWDAEWLANGPRWSPRRLGLKVGD